VSTSENDVWGGYGDIDLYEQITGSNVARSMQSTGLNVTTITMRIALYAGQYWISVSNHLATYSGNTYGNYSLLVDHFQQCYLDIYDEVVLNDNIATATPIVLPFNKYDTLSYSAPTLC
jgi:hypothetical protein